MRAAMQWQCLSVMLGANTCIGPSPGTIAEFGTMQLEFEYLSDISGDNKYREAALKIRDTCDKYKVHVVIFLFLPSLSPPPNSDAFLFSFVCLFPMLPSVHSFSPKNSIGDSARFQRAIGHAVLSDSTSPTLQPDDKLYGIFFSGSGFDGKVTYGGQGDSFYEYLLKGNISAQVFFVSLAHVVCVVLLCLKCL